MKIRFLGTHNMESRDVRTACILIDGVLAIDAGGLTTSLTFPEQKNIKDILITHHHYDHIKDIPMLGEHYYIIEKNVDLYGIPTVGEALQYIIAFPGKLYTNVLEKPSGNPAVNFIPIEPLQPLKIAGYEILPVPVSHSVPATGFQINTPGGKRLFYTGDTGSGLEETWRHVSPDLLVIECTASDLYRDHAARLKHLSPALVKQELISFRSLKGYLPRVITTHHFAEQQEENEIKEELTRLAWELDADITPGYEGMEIDL